jgi:signal peptidase I
MSTEPNTPGPQPPPDAIAPGPPPVVPAGAIVAGPPVEPPRPQPAPPKAPGKPVVPQQQHDGFRELIETIVFVVVLVLILKTFLAEAFVIPTGSMATTLLGYHKEHVCEQCGYRFLVNASSEADPAERERQPVLSFYCENCEHLNDLRRPAALR